MHVPETRNDVGAGEVRLRTGTLTADDGLNANGIASLDGSEEIYVVASRSPIDPIFRRDLESTGATILGYLPERALAVWATGASVRRLDQLDQVHFVAPLDPALKLAGTLHDLPAEVAPILEITVVPAVDAGLVAASLDALGEPDLRLNLSGQPSRNPPGPLDFITYEIVVTNSGDAPALSPSVSLGRDLVLFPDVLPPLPSGASLVGADVIIPLPDLAPGDSQTRSVRLRVTELLPQTSNEAIVTAEASESSCETLLGDNWIEDRSITVGTVADLVVAMNVLTDPSELGAGGSLGVSLFLSNIGTTDAEGVELTLTTQQFALVAAIAYLALSDGPSSDDPARVKGIEQRDYGDDPIPTATVSASVVLPELSGPKISMMRPEGMPRPPSARSSDRAPVEMPGMLLYASSSRRMIEPLPKVFSIWPRARSRAWVF